MADNQFRMLFSSLKIGILEIQNRICTTPHVTQFCNEEGEITQRYIDYEVARGNGGAGLLMLEDATVDPNQRSFPNVLCISDDKYITEMRKLTDAVHKTGTKIGTQIFHPGRQGDINSTKDFLEAPSAIACPTTRVVPKEISLERIQEIVRQFGQAARRAKEAGFDIVEIHGAHGYLVCEFMSGFSNKRTDEYGGSFENRVRLPLEIIAEVRKQVGPDFPFGIRISADEWVEGGIDFDEGKKFAKAFAAAGVNYISVSSANYAFPGITLIIPGMDFPAGGLAYLAAGVREVVDIPILAIGRINNPVLAERILEEGQADFVGMTRALIADPEMPNKAKNGRMEDIRSCVACNHGCIDRLFMGLDITCTVNAAVGREAELKISPADKKKKVMVIGGGPAGLECARVAALRGHDVTLYDERSELGGMNLYAQKLPGRGDFGEVSNWLVSQVNKLGIRINLNNKVDAETVKKEQSDVVVVATGASFIIPQIKGIKLTNGKLANNVLTPIDVMDNAPVGQRVVVYGAGAVGLETAILLKEQGKNVVIVENSAGAVMDIYGVMYQSTVIMPKLEGIELKTSRIIREIQPGNVVLGRMGGLVNSREGAIGPVYEEIIPADTIVLAVGRQPNKCLADQLIGLAPEVYTIGDCVEPSLTYRAVSDGATIGTKI
jgi:2,4-dienoyl-CoA reductase-like NADH-dependent reductase (Old Yellow Enzyme family)/thioredoxin reductase